ncbi:hypothetical protein [Streptomyces antibioticus]|uniref:Uncharacterized protein n=1 Tax=Streptomyces antibioticus TaxID=1890 RepID=A0AAE7CND4_STRAT|nr:hypothetical protein [Streptomyces antibioticus]OOQ47291.1 hypothetical protein AFM16_31620 [Streptomyces antibioticus]QIT47615.1 hypothetical protein HCX60_32175 [Streptomyces antibioticus]
MPRRQSTLLRNLFIASLIILAAMHPQAVGSMAQLGAGLVLAIVQGIATAAADNPGAAAIAGLGVYVTHQIRSHRPRTARPHRA